MALAEGAACAVLTREPHGETLDQQGAEGERLAGGPVDALAGLDHRGLGVEHALHGPVRLVVLGQPGERRADLFQRREVHRGLAALVAPFGPREAGPAAVEPVGLVRAIVLAGLEFGVEMRLEGRFHVLDLALGDQPVGDEALGVDLQRGLVALDGGVHQGLGEHGLVALVVAEPAVAEDVDHRVLVELLPELDGDAGGMDHRLGVVAVDVEDRRLDHECYVRRIGRGAGIHRRRGEADLVVDNEMDGAAGAVTLEAREAEAFRHHALAREGRVAVQQQRQHLRARRITHLRLLGADLAEHHRVDRLEMAGVGGQREMHGIAVELAVRGGAEMVFHVAGALDLVGLVAAALELVEDRAVGFLHHVGEHREPAAVRHADDDVLDAERAAALDDLLHRRDQRLAAVEAEALGAGVFHLEELLVALRLDQLVEDRPPAALGEVDLLAVALDALLEPGRLLGVGDVHVLQREGAAIGAFDQGDDLADRGGLQAEHVVDEDRPVHVGLGEAVGPGIELGMRLGLGEPQRVEIGDQMAADAVGADDHQRAHRIEHRLADLRLAQRRTRLGAPRPHLVSDRPDKFGTPLPVQRRGQFVVRRRRPVGPRPGGPARVQRHVGIGIAEAGEERLPAVVNARGIRDEARMKLLDVIGVLALEERRGMKDRVLRMLGHGSDGLPAPAMRPRPGPVLGSRPRGGRGD